MMRFAISESCHSVALSSVICGHIAWATVAESVRTWFFAMAWANRE